MVRGTHGSVRGWLACTGTLLAAALLAGCGTASGGEQLPVPTFPAATATHSAANAPGDEGLPDDCTRVLGADELAALFARPLGSVAVRSIKGIPEPSVDRIERVGCRYSAVGPAGGAAGSGGGTLLDINTGRYTDADAAHRQWTLNTNAERAGSASEDLQIGVAPAVLVRRPTESLLAVVYGVDTVTFVLPTSAGAPGEPRERLVDLARRVLAAIAPTQPVQSSPPATPTPTALPAARAASTPAPMATAS